MIERDGLPSRGSLQNMCERKVARPPRLRAARYGGQVVKTIAACQPYDYETHFRAEDCSPDSCARTPGFRPAQGRSSSLNSASSSQEPSAVAEPPSRVSSSRRVYGLQAGAGLDYAMTRTLAVRLQVDVRATLAGKDGIEPGRQVRFAAGIVRTFR